MEPLVTAPPSPVPHTPACVAPHAALYFRPDGLVQACCATGYVAGKVTGSGADTLREIWDGAGLAAQRAALEAGSYAYGCQECELAVTAGDRAAALAGSFDRFADGAPHPYPKLMDFALSNRCNLQCVMCHGGLSSAIRAQREHLPPLEPAYGDAFFEQLDEFLPHAERLMFKGGEPFLARENRRVWDELLRIGATPEITVTTNGTIFNAEVARYVADLRMHPIISIDAMRADALESIRVGVHAPTFWANVDRLQDLARSSGAGSTFSFCLMPDNWRELLPLLEEADRRGVGATVVFVNQPARFDLLKLPPTEVAEIHRELSRTPVRFASAQLEEQWLGVLDRLRSQIEHPVALKVRSPNSGWPPMTAARPGVDRAEEEQLCADLRASTGFEPLRLAFDEGAIVSIEHHPWADWFGPQEWMGLHLDQLDEAMSRRTGGRVIPPDGPLDLVGVTRMEVSVETPAQLRTLWVHLFYSSPSGQQRAVIAPAAPGSAP